MATVSSHTLNATDGSHAGGIPVTLTGPDGTVMFDTATDAGGRLSESVDLSGHTPDAVFELVFDTAAYWAVKAVPRSADQVQEQIVLRFRMPDPDGRYHMPLILSPNGYSTWWSTPGG